MKFPYQQYEVEPSPTLPEGVLYRPEVPLRVIGPAGDASFLYAGRAEELSSMKLSTLDRKILRFVRKAYPIPYDPATANTIIAIGERPIPTAADVHQAVHTQTPEIVQQSLDRLISYQCIAPVYLAAREDFAEQVVSPGRRIRHALLKGGAGQLAYQVTKIGEEITNGFLTERAKRVVGKWIGKFLEDYVPLLIAFLLGVLVSALFGWDLEPLRR